MHYYMESPEIQIKYGNQLTRSKAKLVYIFVVAYVQCSVLKVK